MCAPLHSQRLSAYLESSKSLIFIFIFESNFQMRRGVQLRAGTNAVLGWFATYDGTYMIVTVLLLRILHRVQKAAMQSGLVAITSPGRPYPTLVFSLLSIIYFYHLIYTVAVMSA